MPGAWNDSWDIPDPVIHELEASVSVEPTAHFHPASDGSFELYETLASMDRAPPPYLPRTEATCKSTVYNHSALRRDSGYEAIVSFPMIDGPQPANYFDSSDDDDDDIIPDNSPPIVIAVFGQTGTGKTSLIKAVTGKDLRVGHDLTSCKSLLS